MIVAGVLCCCCCCIGIIVAISVVVLIGANAELLLWKVRPDFVFALETESEFNAWSLKLKDAELIPQLKAVWESDTTDIWSPGFMCGG